MNCWKMSDVQILKCKKYMNSDIGYKDMYMLYKTYLNEYIKEFGYVSFRSDPVDTILNNFCTKALS